jgi:hypothetical protein
MPRLSITLDISALQAAALAAQAANERTTSETLVARGALDIVQAITKEYEDQTRLLIQTAYNKATDDEKVSLIAQVKGLASR